MAGRPCPTELVSKRDTTFVEVKWPTAAVIKTRDYSGWTVIHPAIGIHAAQSKDARPAVPKSIRDLRARWEVARGLGHGHGLDIA